MNLFLLDEDPQIAASLQADIHVVKMILETLQMICTALKFSHVPYVWPFQLYKSTHINHPCSQWIRFSSNNYNWALTHGIALCHEYTRRYEKTHKCQEYYNFILQLPSPHFPEFAMNDFKHHNKLSYHSIPLNSKFAVIAISDDVFPECSRFDDAHNLLAVDTYLSYYVLKMKTLKRTMKWHRSETPPIKIQQKIYTMYSSSISVFGMKNQLKLKQREKRVHELNSSFFSSSKKIKTN